MSSNKSSKSSSSMNSLSKGKNSRMSKESSGSERKKLKVGVYERFFLNISENEVKKPLLKNKSLLKRNELMEIGSLCRQEEGLKIKVYITSIE